MMKDFVKTHFNQPVSTEDLKAIVEKHMTPEMNVTGNGKMDWFFNQWVYGTQCRLTNSNTTTCWRRASRTASN